MWQVHESLEDLSSTTIPKPRGTPNLYKKRDPPSYMYVQVMYHCMPNDISTEHDQVTLSAIHVRELFNLSSLVLKARHLGGSSFCNFISWECLSRHLVGFPQALGLIKIKLSELSCNSHAPYDFYGSCRNRISTKCCVHSCLDTTLAPLWPQ